MTVATVLLLTLVSPYATLVLLTNGLMAAGIFLASALFGVCVIPRRWLRPGLARPTPVDASQTSDMSGKPAPIDPVHDKGEAIGASLIWLTAIALGSGTLSLAILSIGCLGILSREFWLIALIAASVAGVVRLWRMPVSPGRPVRPESAKRTLADCLGSVTSAAPLMMLSIIAAAHAPGFLWAEEGFGYDALEYHLEMPREHLEAGRIAYAPHNVYGSFPANVEMLYLLGMILHSDAVEGGLTAHFIHLIFGILTALAATQLAPPGSSAPRRVFLLMLSTPWTLYFSGLAFVENGMLFYGMLSLAWAMRVGASTACADEQTAAASSSGRSARERSVTLSACALSGLLAGLSCGCKYTALPLIAMPTGCAMFIAHRGKATARLAGAGVFVVTAMTMMIPWLVRNIVTTGNPVFPLANHVFRAYPPGWDEDSQKRWDAGHAPAPEERAWASRLRTAAQTVLADPYQRLPVCFWLLAAVALASARRKVPTRPLAWMLILQVVVWLTATHLYARFAVVFMIPLAGLSAVALSPFSERTGEVRAKDVSNHAPRAPRRGHLRHAADWIARAGVLVNFGFCLHMAAREFTSFRQPGIARWFAEGAVPGFEYIKALHDIPKHESILVIGEARRYYLPSTTQCTVVFNQLPFGQAVRRASSPEEVVDWLGGERYGYVLFHWGEISRLRRSRYGFDPAITEELVHRLVEAGLISAGRYVYPGSERPYAELFLIPSTRP